MAKGRRGDKGILVDKPAAILEGGPRDGWAYFIDDLHSLQRIEAYFGRTFPYRETERTVVHPRTFKEVRSQVWEYVAELDPFRPPPPAPPSKLELVAAAAALCGRSGGTAREIADNLPPEMLAGAHRGWLTVSLAPLLWWLTREGVLEDNPNDPWYERRYRRVIDNAQGPAAGAPETPEDGPGDGPPRPVGPGVAPD